MSNLSVVTDLVNRHGYTKFHRLVRNSKNGTLSPRDYRFALAIHKSLSLGFCRRLQIMPYSLFGSNFKIARTVAKVVEPHLLGLRPPKLIQPHLVVHPAGSIKPEVAAKIDADKPEIPNIPIVNETNVEAAIATDNSTSSN